MKLGEDFSGLEENIYEFVWARGLYSASVYQRNKALQIIKNRTVKPFQEVNPSERPLVNINLDMKVFQPLAVGNPS